MKIKCPACSAVLNVPDTAAGKVVKCPCGKQLRAPGGAAPAKPAAPAAGAARPTATGPARPAAAGPARPAAAGPTGRAASVGGSMGDFDAGMLDELTDTDLQPVKSVAKAGRPVAAAPSGAGGKLLQQYASTRDAQAAGLVGIKMGEIAGVGRRISGSLLDGVFIMLFVGIGVGIMIAMFSGAGEEGPDEAMLSRANWIIIGAAILPTIVNAALISMSGQTVGKKIVGTRIVLQSTGAPAGFLHGFLIRNIGFGFFTGLPIIGIFVALADIVYLFLEDHETLHDKLAKTMVVLA